METIISGGNFFFSLNFEQTLLTFFQYSAEILSCIFKNITESIL